MELLRAQREGRETEFKQQEREKKQAKTAASLDAEMDDYFNSRPKKETDASTDATASAAPDGESNAKPNADESGAVDKDMKGADGNAGGEVDPLQKQPADIADKPSAQDADVSAAEAPAV